MSPRSFPPRDPGDPGQPFTEADSAGSGGMPAGNENSGSQEPDWRTGCLRTPRQGVGFHPEAGLGNPAHFRRWLKPPVSVGSSTLEAGDLGQAGPRLQLCRGEPWAGPGADALPLSCAFQCPIQLCPTQLPEDPTQPHGRRAGPVAVLQEDPWSLPLWRKRPHGSIPHASSPGTN